jgi:hypothetical protein
MRQRRRCLCATAAVVLATLLNAGNVAVSEVLIAGDRDDIVMVQLHAATMQELLSALQERFGVAYQSSVALDQRLEGEYSGTLRQILGGALRGYDYTIAYSASDAPRILIIARSGTEAAPNVAAAAGSVTTVAATPAAADGAGAPRLRAPRDRQAAPAARGATVQLVQSSARALAATDVMSGISGRNIFPADPSRADVPFRQPTQDAMTGAFAQATATLQNLRADLLRLSR